MNHTKKIIGAIWCLTFLSNINATTDCKKNKNQTVQLENIKKDLKNICTILSDLVSNIKSSNPDILDPMLKHINIAPEEIEKLTGKTKNIEIEEQIKIITKIDPKKVFSNTTIKKLTLILISQRKIKNFGALLQLKKKFTILERAVNSFIASVKKFL